MVFACGLRHELAAICINTARHVFAFLFCSDDFQPVGDGVVDQQTPMVEATPRQAAGLYDFAVMTGGWVSEFRQLSLE